MKIKSRKIGEKEHANCQSWVDVGDVTLGVSNICSNKSTLIGFTEIGQTRYLEHPDSNPDLSCRTYVQSLVPDSIQEYKLGNCSIRLIEYPKEFDYDTITVVYAPQGPGGALTPCCAGDFGRVIDVFNIYAKIGLQCN